MLRDAVPIGVITLTRREPRPFTDKQIELAVTFADEAAIAIENVRLFDQVQQHTRDLSKSLDDLRAAKDRMIRTEKLAALGQLTAGIAHEIRNPLNFVNNFAALSVELFDELNEVIAVVAPSDEMHDKAVDLTALLKDNLNKIVQHGKRADDIVRNMLVFSREGTGVVRPSDVNLLVEESIKLAYHGAHAEKAHLNVAIRRQFDPVAGMIEVCPDEITRVLLNMIQNGVYALAQRKTFDGDDFERLLDVITRSRGDHVEIRVRDNGVGIPPDVKEKIFNPFFTTKPTGDGTGLGLSISHDIVVKRHGGLIDVETEAGEFTEFTIVLPRKRNC
jgi:signal transduction histidine kinase